MRRATLPLSALLLAIALAGSLSLPKLVSAFNDRQRLGAVHTEQQEEQQAPVSRSMAEKLQLILGEMHKALNTDEADSQGIYSVTSTAPSLVDLRTGNQYDGNTIQPHCLEELKKLGEAGLLATPLPADGASLSNPYLYLSPIDQTASVIVWHLYYEEEAPYLSVSLDDETGKIISFNASAADDLDEDAFRRYGDYLGLTLHQFYSSSVKKGVIQYTAEYRDAQGNAITFPVTDADGFRYFGLSANRSSYISYATPQEYQKIDAKP